MGVLTPEDDGVLTPYAVRLDNVQTVSKQKIEAMISTLCIERLAEVERALAFALRMTRQDLENKKGPVFRPVLSSHFSR